MLANTYDLTIGASPAITLTRVREDGGQSSYVYRARGIRSCKQLRS